MLPASPEEPPMMPLPPRTPRAWVWQCHRCLTVYRLGCTRRCLDCSHTYYIGWEQWGSWRRKVLGFEAAGRCDAKARDRAFLAKKHDCWIDCDSPSECCHRRFELAAELHRTEKATAAEQHSPPVVVGSPPPSPDDDIPLSEALAPDERDKDGNGNGNGEEEKALKSPKSPLGQSSFFWDDDDEDGDDGGSGGGNDANDTKTERKRDEEEEEEEEEKKWWAARSKHESTCASATDSHDCASAVDDDDDEDIGRAAKRLTVRKSDENTLATEDSDSDSESAGSGWSLTSSESNDTSVGACAESSK
ncbi:hypothetical protein F5B17DRAFT_398322 [Nemania serpens]|nr:hypothetical protein F5B17DRAFT_398322 [Nemania serpens]